MPRRPPPLLVTGGQLWTATGRLVEQLAAPEPGDPRPDVLVWDERDEDGRWEGRPAVFVVRDRPLRQRSPRAAVLELRSHLWRRRDHPVVFVGHQALDAAPWLVRHRGPRTWLPTVDDRSVLDAGLTVPSAGAGGPHHVVVADLELVRSERLRRLPGHRWSPGFRPQRPVTPARPEILVWGPPDRTQGVDLVGRALASHHGALRTAGARVRWIVPLGAEVPAAEADDLRRAGVDDLIEIEPHADPEAALRPRLEGAAALLVCGRPGAWTAEDATLWTAFRSGARVIGFGPPPPADLALDGGGDLLAFGDVAGMGAALSRAVQTADRLPGPIGLAGLVRDLAGTVSGG
ncbi:MAG TPA: hypothetical protein VNQ33_11355 [Acidimicrobiales bacterium]|nr:hypothetical protein [Acidimicrobiales bacterium]